METETLMLLLTLLGLLSEALPTRDDETEMLAASSPARDAATEPEVGDRSVVARGSPVSPGAHAHRSRGSAAPRVGGQSDDFDDFDDHPHADDDLSYADDDLSYADDDLSYAEESRDWFVRAQQNGFVAPEQQQQPLEMIKLLQPLQSLEMVELLQTLLSFREADNWQGIAALENEAKAAAEILEREHPDRAVSIPIGPALYRGLIYSALGFAYHSLGRLREAVDMHLKHLAIAQEVGDRAGECMAYGNIGIAYCSLGRLREAVDMHLKQLAIAQKLGDRAGEGRAYGNIGNAYYSLRKPREAVVMHLKHLAIAQEVGEGMVYGNIGCAFYSLGWLREAVDMHLKDLAIAQEVGDRAREGWAYGNIGNAYYSLGRLREAVDMHLKDLAIAQEVGDLAGEGRAYNNLAAALLHDGQHAEAAEHAQRAIARRAVLERKLTGPDGDALRISLFAQQVGSYHILQKALLEGGREGAGPAMGVAGLSKGRALLAAMAGSEGVEGGGVLDKGASEDGGGEASAGGSTDLAARQWAAVQRMAQTERCTVVEYSVLNDGTLVVWLVSKAGELLTWHRAALDCAALGMGAEGMSVADVLEALRIGMKVGGREGLVRDAGASAGAPVEGNSEVPEASPRDLVLQLASEHRNPARKPPSTGELVQKAQECLATCEDQEKRAEWEIVIKELPEVHAWLDAWLEEHVLGDDEMRRSAVRRLKSKVQDWQMVRDEVPGVRADASSAAADALALSAYVEAAVREHELVRRWLVKQEEQLEQLEEFIEEVVPPPPREPMPQVAPRGLAVMTWLTKTIVAAVRYRIKDAVVSVVEGVHLILVLRNLLGTATSWRSLKELLDLLALNRSFHLGKPSGLNWKAIGTCKPASGRELHNAKLAHALKTKTELTARQRKVGIDDLRHIYFELELPEHYWAWVGIDDLRSDDFIESHGIYFRPAGPVGLSPLQARTLCDLGVSTDPAWADSAAGRFLISRIGALFSHERILKGLHEMLLEPVAAALEEERKQGGEELQELLIIPHQDLFAVPWAALLDGSRKYLIQKYALRVAPSLGVAHQASSALASERDGGGTCHERHAVVVGNPELCEERRQLPHAEKEAEHVAWCLDGNGSTNRRFGRVAKLLKADACKDAVLEALGGTGPQDGAASRPSPRVHWLHLACHFDLSTNALLLARRTASKTLSSRESDLSMEEVRRMVKLPPGCTAVLGACNSGRGEIVSEGVVGLSRSFLAAGAGAVVSSLWTINDASTRALMTRFYEELLRGERVPQALRLAMLSLIDSESWMAAPVFWAGFMVVGASTSLLP